MRRSAEAEETGGTSSKYPTRRIESVLGDAGPPTYFLMPVYLGVIVGSITGEIDDRRPYQRLHPP